MDTRSAGGERWQGDTKGHGIGNGLWIEPDVTALFSELSSPGWVAEEPEVHLLPHLRDACDLEESPWILHQSDLIGSVFTITLDWTRHAGALRELRSDVFALLGSIAESTSFVRQRITNDAVEYWVATGMLSTDMSFRSHGHLLLFRISGQAVESLCRSQRESSAPLVARIENPSLQ